MSLMPQFSIIMPTYNDEKYIEEAIESILNQNFKDFELIIIDNNSSDSTRDILRKYSTKSPSIKVLVEKKPGQLNAIYKAVNKVNGEIIMLLHSDDMIREGALMMLTKIFKTNPKIDGVYGDLVRINHISRSNGIIKTSNVVSLGGLLAFAGSNIIPDVFCVKRSWFYKGVLRNYILWNMPYWFYVQDKTSIRIAQLKKVQSFYKYRVYTGNYIHSDVGRFVAINGRLRTILTIGKLFSIPLITLQRKLYYLTGMRYTPLIKHSVKNYPKSLLSIVSFAINSVYKNNVPWYVSYILDYLRNYNKNLVYDITVPRNVKLYYGKDVRLFYRDLNEGTVPSIYVKLMDNATEGFGIIKTNRPEVLKIILNFLNIPAKVV